MSRTAVWMSVVLVAAVGAAEPAPAARKADDELRKDALALNDLSGAEAMQKGLERLMADPARAKKLLAVAVKTADAKGKPFNRNATLVLALLADNLKDTDAAVSFYKLNAKQSAALGSERGVAQAMIGLIDLYAKNKRYADVEKTCREFMGIKGEEGEAVDKLKPLVMRQLVVSIARQGAGEKALKIVNDLIEDNPDNWLNLALKAQVQRDLEKYEDASKTLLELIDRVNKEERLKDDEKSDFLEEYRYALSGVYTDLNQVEKAADQLKILLKREPNNTTYNNDLGFIWADKGMNLPEAEKLIRKAIEEDRKRKAKTGREDKTDSAAYLDSLGWVLFKQGKLKEAKEQLLLATKEKEGHHLEIFDHLADVHMALGEKAEAVAAWKKGLENATDSPRDKKRKVAVQAKLEKAGK